MRGVTVWVTNAAVWVTGKVGDFINATASPDVGAAWFVGQYRCDARDCRRPRPADALTRGDTGVAPSGRLDPAPLRVRLPPDGVHPRGRRRRRHRPSRLDHRRPVRDGRRAGSADSSDNLLESVGQAYSDAIEDDSGGAVPLFGVFLGAIILAIGAFVLWLEMVIRDAAIYIALFFVPLTFVAMIWPATSRYARRLVEFLIAVILAKFVIVAIIGLASAAITNAGATGAADDGQMFERMIAGAALLVLAAWSPFALLRLIPMMEIAAASVVTQRSSMSGAAGSAGVHSPAVLHAAGDGSALSWRRHRRRTRSPSERSTAVPSGARASATASSATAREATSGPAHRDKPEPFGRAVGRSRRSTASAAPSARHGTTAAPPTTRVRAAANRAPSAVDLRSHRPTAVHRRRTW